MEPEIENKKTQHVELQQKADYIKARHRETGKVGEGESRKEALQELANQFDTHTQSHTSNKKSFWEFHGFHYPF